MERKGGTRTVEVLEETRTLSAEEEKALRMRRGSKVALNAPLAQVAPAGSALGDELLLMEMQLLRSFRARNGRPVAAAAAPVLASKTKDKIVRALRKKR